MKKKGILIVLLVLALILAAGSMFTVAEDEYACTVRFSKIIDTCLLYTSPSPRDS